MKRLITIVILVMLSNNINSQINSHNKKNNKNKVEKEVVLSPNIKEFIPVRQKLENYIVQPNFDKKLVIREIAHLLDSIREYIYSRDLLVTEVDSIASKGCEHHCIFMKNLVNPNNPNLEYLSHEEFNKDDETIYIGKDTLISDWVKRNKFFSKGLMTSGGEVCSVGPLSLISYKGATPKEIAKNIVYDFFSSKEHWEILTSVSYTRIAADIQIKKNKNGTYTYWFTLVTGHKVTISKKMVKNTLYFPNDSKLKNSDFLPFTKEYYEVVEKKILTN
jgi:hypothetical protein